MKWLKNPKIWWGVGLEWHPLCVSGGGRHLSGAAGVGEPYFLLPNPTPFCYSHFI
jgi:hypothetical protein